MNLGAAALWIFLAAIIIAGVWREKHSEQPQTLPEEPFLCDPLKIIEKRQSRRLFLQSLIPVLSFAGCAILSPFLIKGSVLLSGSLNAIINTTAAYLDIPTGVPVTAIGAVLLWFFNRRHICRFI